MKDILSLSIKKNHVGNFKIDFDFIDFKNKYTSLIISKDLTYIECGINFLQELCSYYSLCKEVNKIVFSFDKINQATIAITPLGILIKSISVSGKETVYEFPLEPIEIDLDVTY